MGAATQKFDLRDAPINVMWSIDTPIICAINGAAAGYGMDMTLLCDMRIASENAKMAAVTVTATMATTITTKAPIPKARIAALWKLPVVWVCENNAWAGTTPVSLGTAVTDIADLAGSYSIPGRSVDGNDVLAVYGAAAAAVERARAGQGPSMVEAKTYRYYNHHGIKNIGLSYRTDDEVAETRALLGVLSRKVLGQRGGGRPLALMRLAKAALEGNTGLKTEIDPSESLI